MASNSNPTEAAPEGKRAGGRAARWRRRGKIASFLFAIHVFVTLAQYPVTLRMAENAGHELCAMARRGELQNWQWPQLMRGVVNGSPSLPEHMQHFASRLARSCTVRVYPLDWVLGVITMHIYSEVIDDQHYGYGYGTWIGLRYHLLWTPLFDLLRSVGYDGRIEIIGFGYYAWEP